MAEATREAVRAERTGEPLSARFLAHECNRTADEAWTAAERSLGEAESRPYPEAVPATLDATIRIVHGTETLADNTGSDAAMCEAFERVVAERYGAARADAPLR